MTQELVLPLKVDAGDSSGDMSEGWLWSEGCQGWPCTWGDTGAGVAFWGRFRMVFPGWQLVFWCIWTGGTQCWAGGTWCPAGGTQCWTWGSSAQLAAQWVEGSGVAVPHNRVAVPCSHVAPCHTVMPCHHAMPYSHAMSPCHVTLSCCSAVPSQEAVPWNHAAVPCSHTALCCHAVSHAMSPCHAV